MDLDVRPDAVNLRVTCSELDASDYSVIAQLAEHYQLQPRDPNSNHGGRFSPSRKIRIFIKLTNAFWIGTECIDCLYPLS